MFRRYRIGTALTVCAVGLTLSLVACKKKPADKSKGGDMTAMGMGGTDSNQPGTPGCRLALGATPIPPCSIAPRSVTMSPNRLVVTAVSIDSGLSTIRMQAAST